MRSFCELQASAGMKNGGAGERLDCIHTAIKPYIYIHICTRFEVNVYIFLSGYLEHTDVSRNDKR